MPPAVRRLVAALLGLLLALAGFVVATPSPAPAQPGTIATRDTVLYWNDVLLEAFRREGGGPGPLARAAAMMHTGIYELINANWWVGRSSGSGYRGYRIIGFFERSDLEDDDAGFVAAHLLRDALPGQAAFVEQAFQDRYGYDLLKTGANDNTRSVLDMIRIDREDDGSQVATPYPFESVPGAWQLTGHACDSPTGPTGPVTPNWGRVTPFVLDAPDQFRPPFPGGAASYTQLLGSGLYATQHDEVRQLGRFDSTERTAEQEEIAWFWANDLDGTYKPVGQLLHHTRLVTDEFGVDDPLGVGEAVAYSRLFALVSLALADAGIAAWDSKYETGIDLWRPQTAIQRADEDGNPGTVQDPGWLPLSADRPSVGAPRFNPCFPSWTSGHATFAGAWAGVMRAEYGDALPEPILLDSEDPRSIGVHRSFGSFTQIAEENAVSRLYLGVHYRFDATSGTALGLDVGGHVQSQVLTEQCLCSAPVSISTPAGRHTMQ